MIFPEHPNLGDEYEFEDTVYKFNGKSWDRSVIGSQNRTGYAHALLTANLLARIAHLEALIENGILLID